MVIVGSNQRLCRGYPSEQSDLTSAERRRAAKTRRRVLSESEPEYRSVGRWTSGSPKIWDTQEKRQRMKAYDAHNLRDSLSLYIAFRAMRGCPMTILGGGRA